MALMTSIRNNLTKLFAALAVLFILFILFDWGMDLPSLRFGKRSGDVIGFVNGKKIGYRDFAELVRRATESQKQQSGSDPDDAAERQIRNQVWNMLVNQMLVDEEIQRLGITVTDREIIDLVHGPNPPEMLVNQFRDSTGKFNRQAYDEAIINPQNREAWIQVEQQLREQLKQQKLQSLLGATALVTEDEIRQRYEDRHTTLEAEYVLFDPARLVPDSLVSVSDEDIRKYYSTHQDEFKVQAARKLKYVQFRRVPSAADTAEIKDELNRLVEQARSGMDFKELASTYSEIPFAEAYFKHGELSRAKEKAVFSAKKGEIVGPISDYDGMHVIKILDERRGGPEFVRVSHILIRSGSDSVAALQKARDLVRRLRSGADFAELAKEYSEDPGSAVRGGDVGWGGKGTWVKPFEQAAMRAKVGEIVGPIETQFGWHILKVTARDNREVKLATITMKVKPSSQTVDEMYSHAEDFAYLANEEGFEHAAEFSSYDVRETPEFTKGGIIPGIGFSDAVTEFAFNGSLNDISKALTIPDGVGVFKITSVREEGVQSLDAIRSTVESKVRREKKLQRVRAEAEKMLAAVKQGEDLTAAAASFPGTVTNRTGAFKPTDAPAGVGRDQAFVGAALALKPGEVSQPVEGSRGYYVIKLLSESPFDSTAYSVEHNSIRSELLQTKQGQIAQGWLSAMRERADIEDFRDQFYR